MCFGAKMKRICDNVRKHTYKNASLTLDDIAVEIENINQKLEPFFAKALDVNSVSEMTDTTKIYRYNGTIWVYRNGETIIEPVTENITTGFESGRVGSSGTVSTQSGYVTTPYIDLSKYPSPFTLHLKGISFSYDSVKQSYITHGQYKADKTFVKRWTTQATTFTEGWKNAVYADNGDGTCQIVFTKPITEQTGATEIAYARFTGYGTATNANVYVTYENSIVIEPAWIDTGINSEEIIPTVTNFTPVNNSVKSFMDAVTYADNDYSYTEVTRYNASDGSRKDQPAPYTLDWTAVENAMVYAVSLNNLTYYSMKNTVSVLNLIPNNTYTYRVYALCADGSMVTVKSGSFTTTGCQTRMLNIDGIQNVRDIGGYAVAGATVKYGLIYRGSAMDETTHSGAFITDAGKQELLLRVGVKTDLDLRGANNVSASALGNAVDFYTNQYSYQQYADAITQEIHRGYFKDMLEYIVEQLAANKPIYIHCTGGNDRTGTLVFLLLGLLGVSESDLAKEYELSAFSEIGVTRYRNSTIYDYKGLVSAIKAYSGTTITDKFHAFAVSGCGISEDTIASFCTMMLS